MNGYFFQMYGQKIGFPVVSHLQNIDRARNSAGECYLHTVEVVGSNPIAPNIRPVFGLVFVFVFGYGITVPKYCRVKDYARQLVNCSYCGTNQEPETLHTIFPYKTSIYDVVLLCSFQRV